MNRRANLVSASSVLLFFATCSQIKAADATVAGSVGQAVIYYSFAPWDGAAYDIEIPLEHADGASQPNIRINIWGYPEFQGPKTIRFSGEEDPGGGISKGDGRALFQTNLNKSTPERLAGSISFTVLQNGHPVFGTYEFATMDGKRKFKGSFQANWGNEPTKAIR